MTSAIWTDATQQFGMAVLLKSQAITDAGGPAAAVSATNTTTTASYTPTAGTLQVAIVSAGNANNAAWTSLLVTDSVAGSWTRLANVQAVTGSGTQIWVKDAGPSPAAQTVTATALPSTIIGVQLVVRQASGAAPAASQNGVITTQNALTPYALAITPGTSGSLVYGAFGRSSSSAVLTANAATTIYNQSVLGGGGTQAAIVSAALTTAGTPVTLGFTAAATGSNSFALAEIVQSSTTPSPIGSLSSTTGGLTVPDSPSTIGNALVLAIKIPSGTATVTGVSGGNASWALLAGPYVDTSGTPHTHYLYLGTATAAGASTITVTLSAGTAADLDVQEFTAGTGISWAVDGTQTGFVNKTATSTTVTYPSLTPAAAGELYVGHSRCPSGSAYSGLTAGFTGQIDAAANPFIYGIVGAVMSPTETSAATTPNFSIAALVIATFGTVITNPVTATAAAAFPQCAVSTWPITPATITVAAAFPQCAVAAVIPITPSPVSASAAFPAPAVHGTAVFPLAVAVAAAIRAPSVAPLVPPLFATAEGGTDGVTVTPANSWDAAGDEPFTVVTVGAGATFAYGASYAAHGNLSYQAATTTAAAVYAQWTVRAAVYGQLWFRMYMYYPANPAQNYRILGFMQGGTYCGYVQIQSTGRLAIISNTGATMVNTAPTIIPLGKWFRIEGYLLGSATVGQAELKLFPNFDAVTPVGTWTSAATFNTLGTIDNLTFGDLASRANTAPYWMDDLGISSTGYLGPVIPTPYPPVIAVPAVFPAAVITSTSVNVDAVLTFTSATTFPAPVITSTSVNVDAVLTIAIPVTFRNVTVKSTSVTIPVTALTAASAFPAWNVSGSAAPAPAAVTAAAAFPACIVRQDQNITPAAVTAAAAFPACIVRQDRNVNPAALAVTASVPVPARWVLIQATAAVPTATGTVSKAFTSPVGSGHRIFVYTGTCFGVDAAAPTDSQSNTYTQLAGAETSSSQVFADIWTTVASATGTLTITVTNSGSQSMGFTAEEYTGLSNAPGAGCLDVSAAGAGIVAATGSITSGTTPVTTAPGELAVSCAADWGGTADTFTVTGGGFAQDAAASIGGNLNQNVAAASTVPASGATVSCTWNAGSAVTTAIAVVAVIKAAAPGTMVTPATVTVTTVFPASAVSPAPSSLAVTSAQPAVTVTGSAADNPVSLTVTAAFPAAAVIPGPAAFPVTTAFPAVTIVPGPGPLVVSAAFPAVALSGNTLVLLASALAVTTGFPLPVVRQDQNITPAVLAASTTFPVAAVTPGPAALTATTAFPACTVTPGPARLPVTAAFPVAAITPGPAALPVTTAFPVAAITPGPAALPVTTTFPVAAVSPGPATLPVTTTFPAPVFSPYPPTVAVTTAFPAPSVTVITVVSPSALAVATVVRIAWVEAGRVGVYLSGAMGSGGGGSGFANNNALWLSWTGIANPAARYYLALSTFGIQADMTAMIAAGVKICLTVRPAYNPVSATDLANLTTLLQNLRAAGAIADIALWHEPYYQGLTSAQFIAMWNYYAPTVQQYYPTVFVPNVASLAVHGEGAYYPGDAYVSKVAVDIYDSQYKTGQNMTAAAAIADSASPPKPFGIWEFDGSTNPSAGQSQADVTTFFTYIQTFMAARLAAGKQNADILLFPSLEGNWLGNASTQNAGMTGGIGNWAPYTAGNCTTTYTTAQAHSPGPGSMAMTSVASGAMTSYCNLGATLGMPVVAGTSAVGVQAWTRAATSARTCQVNLIWYTAAGALLSVTSGAASTNSTSGWTQYTLAGVTAPATAAFCLPSIQVNATGAANEVHYAEDVYLFITSSVPSQCNPILFGWDYRIGLWQTLYAALSAAPYAGNNAAAGASDLLVTTTFPQCVLGISPVALTVSTAFPACAVRQDRNVIAATVAASAAFPAAAVTPGPAALLATSAFPAASVSPAPAALAVTSSFPACAVTPGPATLAVTSSFPAAAVSPGPAALKTPAAFPAPIVRQDQNITLASLAVTTALVTPAATGSAVASPPAIAVSAVTTVVTWTYYVSPTGSDSSNGRAPGTAWQTVAKVSAAVLNPGDTVLFQGGQTFSGTTLAPVSSGTAASPIVFGSYGTGQATITNASGTAIYVYEAGGITISNLIITGPGAVASRSGGYCGIYFNRDIAGQAPAITITGCVVSGWSSGVLVGASLANGGYNGITVTNCQISANLNDGINVYGTGYSHANVNITGCQAYSQLGDSTNTTTSSGHGIAVGNTIGGTISLCSTYSNGISCGSLGAGPIGTWIYHCQNYTISNCVSYQNKSAGAAYADGSGFDLDDSNVNCVLEYSLAYGNNGAGIACYSADTTWTGNTIRYNLTWGNGALNPNQAELYLTGYGGAPGTLASGFIYGNTFIAQDNAAAGFPNVVMLAGAAFSSFSLRNNIFANYGHGNMIWTDSAYTGVLFQGNDWYSANTFNITWGGSSYSTMAAWQTAQAQEKLSGSNTGIQANPLLITPGTAPSVTNPAILTGALGLGLQSGSPCIGAGLNLLSLFGIAPGTQDYFGGTLTIPLPIGGAMLSGGTTASPATVNASGAFPPPAATGSATVNLTALLVSAAFPAAAVSPGPARLTVTSAFTAAAVTPGPAVLAVASAFPAATVTPGPAVLAVASAFPAAAVSPGPAALAVTCTFPVVTVATTTAPAPAALTVTTAFPACTVAPGPAALTVTSSFPAVTASGSALISPAAFAVTAAFPLPVVRQDQNVIPATMGASVSFPLATVVAGSIDSPGLEIYGFGAFAGIGPGTPITNITVAVTEFASSIGMSGATFELWDYSGAPTRIGTIATGTASTTPGHIDSAAFVTVTSSQLATLRVRIYAHSGNAGSGATESVDAVGLTAVYVEPRDLVQPATVAVTTAIPAPIVTVTSSTTVTIAGPVTAPTAMPLATAGLLNAALFRTAVLATAVIPAAAVSVVYSASVTVSAPAGVACGVPAVIASGNVSGPNYGTLAGLLGGGTGTWTGAGNADGPPDGNSAVWTKP